MPKRIQRKRTKGWRMPEGAVYVGRPSRWGNPINWQDYSPVSTGIDGPGDDMVVSDAERRRWAVVDFDDAVTRTGFGLRLPYPSKEEIRAELAGKDLSCWCPLDHACHADVLLQLANAEPVHG